MWPNVEFQTQLPKKNPDLVRLSLQRTTRGWASEKAPEHLATPLGSCMYFHVMPPKSRITCHKGELDYQYSKSLDPIAYGVESQQYFLIFIHGNAIPLVSLSFGQLHGYNILI